MEIVYKKKWTEVTITHIQQYIASYEAGKKPSGAPQKLSVYERGTGNPVKGSDKVEMMLEWKGDHLVLYLRDLNSFAPSDEHQWEIDGMEFEKYDEVID